MSDSSTQLVGLSEAWPYGMSVIVNPLAQLSGDLRRPPGEGAHDLLRCRAVRRRVGRPIGAPPHRPLHRPGLGGSTGDHAGPVEALGAGHEVELLVQDLGGQLEPYRPVQPQRRSAAACLRHGSTELAAPLRRARPCGPPPVLDGRLQARRRGFSAALLARPRRIVASPSHDHPRLEPSPPLGCGRPHRRNGRRRESPWPRPAAEEKKKGRGDSYTQFPTLTATIMRPTGRRGGPDRGIRAGRAGRPCCATRDLVRAPVARRSMCGSWKSTPSNRGPESFA